MVVVVSSDFNDGRRTIGRRTIGVRELNAELSRVLLTLRPTLSEQENVLCGRNAAERNFVDRDSTDISFSYCPNEIPTGERSTLYATAVRGGLFHPDR